MDLVNLKLKEGSRCSPVVSRRASSTVLDTTIKMFGLVSIIEKITKLNKNNKIQGNF